MVQTLYERNRKQLIKFLKWRKKKQDREEREEMQESYTDYRHDGGDGYVYNAEEIYFLVE